MTASDPWNAIVQDSERLGAQDNFGIPRPQRTLAQIEEQARRLRESHGVVSSLSDRSAAAQLLQGAINTSALTKRTANFNVKPGAVEAGQSAVATVPEYLEQLGRRNVTKAVQARLADCNRRFESFMLSKMDRDWEATRKAVLQGSLGSLTPTSPFRMAGPGHAQPGGRLASPMLASPQQAVGYAQIALDPVPAAMATAIQKFRRQQVHAGRFSVLEEFCSATADLNDMRDPAPNRLETLWRVVRTQNSAVNAEGVTADAGKRQRAAVLGSLHFLEESYYKFIEKRVREDRQVALPGGSGTDSATLHAFVDSLAHRAASGPPDRELKNWQVVYHALRAGIYQEAIRIASEPHNLFVAGLHHIASSLKSWLEARNVITREVPEAVAADIRQHCTALIRSQELVQHPQLVKCVVLVLCVLCGSDGPLSEAMEGPYATLRNTALSSIEDWLWFRAGIVLAQPWTGLSEEGPLRLLQDDLSRAPPEHYSKNGERPLQYVIVLFLSLQYKRALHFLAYDRLASKLKDVSPAFAIVLHELDLLSLGGSGDLGAAVYEGEGSSADGLPPSNIASKVLADYGRSVYGHVPGQGCCRDSKTYLMLLRLAADCLLLAGAPGGGGGDERKQQILEEAFRTWVLETNELRVLTPADLELFEPRPSDREVVMLNVAKSLRHDQPETAGVLFELAGRYDLALQHLNQQYSKEVKRAFTGLAPPADLPFDYMRRRGHELIAGFEDYRRTASERVPQKKLAPQAEHLAVQEQAFRQLGSIAEILEADQKIRAAPATTPSANVSSWVQTVNTETRNLRVLPYSEAEIGIFAREAMNRLPTYISKELLRLVIVAAVRALAQHAVTSPATAEAARQQIRNIKLFAATLNAEGGMDFLPRSTILALNQLA